MPRFKLLVDDGRCRRVTTLLGALAGIAATLVATPVAQADLTSRAHPAAVMSGQADQPGDGLLSLVYELRPRLDMAADMPGDVLGPYAELPGSEPSMSLWLAQAWPLGLAIRPTPAALLTLWLTGGVHQVLGWIAPPVSARDRALGQILGDINVEPVTGAETSSYGYRRDPFTRRRKMHKGVDYRAPRGTPVVAAGPGVVKFARRKSGYGRVVMIDHGQGVQTRYAHLQSIEVDAGERVSPGRLIGTVGSTGRATGPHLHFELRIDGEAYDPLQVLGPLTPFE
ncbi:MAG TPA: M23 family metallopeptidase [Haliangium sp.]|nr:M23 family metallopeptidase [Haliangium sp.]